MFAGNCTKALTNILSEHRVWPNHAMPVLEAYKSIEWNLVEVSSHTFKNLLYFSTFFSYYGFMLPIYEL